MRKKPPGELLPQAHQVDREFRMLEALSSVQFPVPRPILYCSDTSIIGTEFYLMEYVKGRIFRDDSLPSMQPAERSAIFTALIQTLARLHSVDWRAAGLSSFHRPGSYVERQIALWSRQYALATKIGLCGYYLMFLFNY